MTTTAPAAVTVLHAFDPATPGQGPAATPTLVGGVLYGATLEGGASGTGTLFRLGADGSGYAKLHDFDALNDPSGEGSFPSGPLTAMGGLLYGVTEFGGDAFDGVVFQIGQDGSGYTPLHEFDMNASPAVSPVGGVVVDGTTLLGATLFGSSTTEGALYSVDTSGANFSVLHAFAGDGSEGEEIAGPLALDDGLLWGVASFGGDFDGGTLFGAQTSGAGFSVLHHFGDGDGATPVGGVLRNEDFLYGVTQEGGLFDEGVVYRIAPITGAYQVLHDFQGSATDGSAPVGGLTLVGDRLFGVTAGGGPSSAGTIFSIATDGAGFRLHHAFSGPDGSAPAAGLTYDGASLYGTASSGGANGGGVVFALDPAAIDGDYNRDGAVDAADYTVWRDTLGSTTDLTADGDFSGVVDAADYTLWSGSYGESIAATAQSIPEPASALLAGLTLAAALVCRGSRR